METTPKPAWIASAYSPDYEELVASWGHTVLSFDTIGSYQGDHLALLRDGDRYGIVVIGYGSCSGCDALEDAVPWDEYGDWSKVVALRDRLHGDIRWYDTAAGAAAYLNGALENPDGTGWYLYDDEAKDVLRAYRDRVAA